MVIMILCYTLWVQYWYLMLFEPPGCCSSHQVLPVLDLWTRSTCWHERHSLVVLCSPWRSWKSKKVQGWKITSIAAESELNIKIGKQELSPCRQSKQKNCKFMYMVSRLCDCQTVLPWLWPQLPQDWLNRTGRNFLGDIFAKKQYCDNFGMEWAPFEGPLGAFFEQPKPSKNGGYFQKRGSCSN